MCRLTICVRVVLSSCTFAVVETCPAGALVLGPPREHGDPSGRGARSTNQCVSSSEKSYISRSSGLTSAASDGNVASSNDADALPEKQLGNQRVDNPPSRTPLPVPSPPPGFTPSVLSHEQISTFLRDGVVVVPGILSRSGVRDAMDGLESTLAASAGVDVNDLAATAAGLAKLSSTGGAGGVLDVFYPRWKLAATLENPRYAAAISDLYSATYGKPAETLLRKLFSFAWEGVVLFCFVACCSEQGPPLSFPRLVKHCSLLIFKRCSLLAFMCSVA